MTPLSFGDSRTTREFEKHLLSPEVVADHARSLLTGSPFAIQFPEFEGCKAPYITWLTHDFTKTLWEAVVSEIKSVKHGGYAVTFGSSAVGKFVSVRGFQFRTSTGWCTDPNIKARLSQRTFFDLKRWVRDRETQRRAFVRTLDTIFRKHQRQVTFELTRQMGSCTFKAKTCSGNDCTIRIDPIEGTWAISFE